MFAATAGVAWFVPQGKGLDGDGLRDAYSYMYAVLKGLALLCCTANYA